MRAGRRMTKYLALLLVPFALNCVRLANYSETEYQFATSLKVETLNLMDKGTEQYSQHAAEVEKLTVDLQKAYEYANNRPNNEISAKQWQILQDPNGNLVGGFTRLWKAQGTVSAAYITSKKKQVGDAFDAIASFESGKTRASSGAAEEN